jgi:hypothetical protein
VGGPLLVEPSVNDSITSYIRGLLHLQLGTVLEWCGVVSAEVLREAMGDRE